MTISAAKNSFLLSPRHTRAPRGDYLGREGGGGKTVLASQKLYRPVRERVQTTLNSRAASQIPGNRRAGAVIVQVSSRLELTSLMSVRAVKVHVAKERHRGSAGCCVGSGFLGRVNWGGGLYIIGCVEGKPDSF